MSVSPGVVGMIDDPFVAHRRLLFTVAYELLGSAEVDRDLIETRRLVSGIEPRRVPRWGRM